MQILQHVACYFLGTCMHGLIFRRPLVTQTTTTTAVSSVFSDADHTGDGVTRRSATEWMVMLYGTAIAWGSKLQSVAKSTTAAEIIAVSAATDQWQPITASSRRGSLHYQKLLRKFGIPVELMTPRVDNQAVLKRMKNEIEDGLTRYLATNNMHTRPAPPPFRCAGCLGLSRAPCVGLGFLVRLRFASRICGSLYMRVLYV
jgi:hypothetical protein